MRGSDPSASWRQVYAQYEPAGSVVSGDHSNESVFPTLTCVQPVGSQPIWRPFGLVMQTSSVRAELTTVADAMASVMVVPLLRMFMQVLTFPDDDPVVQL